MRFASSNELLKEEMVRCHQMTSQFFWVELALSRRVEAIQILEVIAQPSLFKLGMTQCKIRAKLEEKYFLDLDLRDLFQGKIKILHQRNIVTTWGEH